MLWIPITLLAAAAQTLRFMFQKRLRIATLSTGGATFARFLYAAPLIGLVTIGYAMLRGYGTVAYTHLTLPTDVRVWGAVLAAACRRSHMQKSKSS
mgnify:CR=1 FL=1